MNRRDFEVSAFNDPINVVTTFRDVLSSLFEAPDRSNRIVWTQSFWDTKMIKSKVIVGFEASDDVPVSSTIEMVLNSDSEERWFIIVVSKPFKPIVSNLFEIHRKSGSSDLGESHEEHVQGKLVYQVD